MSEPSTRCQRPSVSLLWRTGLRSWGKKGAGARVLAGPQGEVFSDGADDECEMVHGSFAQRGIDALRDHGSVALRDGLGQKPIVLPCADQFAREPPVGLQVEFGVPCAAAFAEVERMPVDHTFPLFWSSRGLLHRLDARVTTQPCSMLGRTQSSTQSTLLLPAGEIASIHIGDCSSLRTTSTEFACRDTA